MIGVYTKNKFLTDHIISLFQQLGATKWKENETYQSVILYLDKPELNQFFKKNSTVPAICLETRHPKAFYTLSLPLKLEELQSAILQSLSMYGQQATYENTTFLFVAKTRQLTNKRTKKSISLTEKESDLIAFLSQQPKHSATRDQVLTHVWQYNENTETHTIESHVYSLRQKLEEYADDLIQFKEGLISLV